MLLSRRRGWQQQQHLPERSPLDQLDHFPRRNLFGRQGPGWRLRDYGITENLSGRRIAVVAAVRTRQHSLLRRTAYKNTQYPALSAKKPGIVLKAKFGRDGDWPAQAAIRPGGAVPLPDGSRTKPRDPRPCPGFPTRERSPQTDVLPRVRPAAVRLRSSEVEIPFPQKMSSRASFLLGLNRNSSAASKLAAAQRGQRHSVGSRLSWQM